MEQKRSEARTAEVSGWWAVSEITEAQRAVERSSRLMSGTQGWARNADTPMHGAVTDSSSTWTSRASGLLHPHNYEELAKVHQDGQLPSVVWLPPCPRRESWSSIISKVEGVLPVRLIRYHHFPASDQQPQKPDLYTLCASFPTILERVHQSPPLLPSPDKITLKAVL